MEDLTQGVVGDGPGSRAQASVACGPRRDRRAAPTYSPSWRSCDYASAKSSPRSRTGPRPYRSRSAVTDSRDAAAWIRRQRSIAQRRLVARSSVRTAMRRRSCQERRHVGVATAQRERITDVPRSDGDAGDETTPADGRTTLDPPGDADPREQAGRREGDEPRIAGLDGREEGLGAKRLQLVDDADDRRDEEEERGDAQPDDRGEGAIAARDRRPRDAAKGDDDRRAVRPTRG